MDQNGVLSYEYYPMVAFRVYLFRNPLPFICMYFAPMVLFTLFLICLCFGVYKSSDKLGIISTLLLAILSYQILYRQAMPLASEMSIGDKYVYSALLASVLALFDGLIASEEAYFRGFMAVLGAEYLFLVIFYIYRETYKKYMKYLADIDQMNRPR